MITLASPLLAIFLLKFDFPSKLQFLYAQLIFLVFKELVCSFAKLSMEFVMTQGIPGESKKKGVKGGTGPKVISCCFCISTL